MRSSDAENWKDPGSFIGVDCAGVLNRTVDMVLDSGC